MCARIVTVHGDGDAGLLECGDIAATVALLVVIGNHPNGYAATMGFDDGPAETIIRDREYADIHCVPGLFQ